MILNGLGAAKIFGTPGGRHLTSDSSLACAKVFRSLVSASAQGWIGSSPGLKSAAILIRYFAPAGCHTPDKSGLRSAFRGAGAVRSGLPSLVIGTPSVGTFSHCVGAVEQIASKKRDAIGIRVLIARLGYHRPGRQSALRATGRESCR